MCFIDQKQPVAGRIKEPLQVHHRIEQVIQQLVNYGLDTGLILPDDEIYIRNQLLMTETKTLTNCFGSWNKKSQTAVGRQI